MIDLTGLILCLVFLFVHKIRFEIRASATLLAFYVIGVSVILSVGPLSGGPAWLFAFAVLAGILMGNHAAIVAITLNAVTLLIIGLLFSTKKMGIDFPFFKSPQTMISTGFNFIVLNAITSFSVAALLKGLNSNEKRYRLMADNVADVIWTTDMNLNFTYISPSILQVQGYTPQEFMKKSIEQTLLPESFDMAISLYKSKLKQVEAKDKAAWDPVSFEAEQYCKDGTIIWTSIHARIILGPDNTPESILGITRDICEQKKNEKEKINAQIIAGEHKKLALVGQIAGKMAHDFNNVLGIIMGHAELALINTHDPEIRKTLDLIFNQTLRGKNLTKNLITFAKSTEPRQESFLINEKIDFVINLVKNDLDTIEVIKKDLVPLEIIADPGMIEHALVNLFQNSIHALSLSQAPQIIIRAYAVNDNIVFEIQDNGCGIPEEHLDNIYEPSFTLKGSRDEKGAYEPGIKGTGYGMANVKKYVELHKGRISVTSQAGHGTRVRICLPIIRKKLTSKEKQKIRDTTRHYNKQILLVEDEPAIADIQFNVLTHPPCSHAVDVASNGQAAIDLFETNHYDLISLDYILPGKLNGMDVYHHLRKKDPLIPILFISGNIEFLESIKRLKQKDQCIDHLSKPCMNLDYINSISQLLAKQKSKPVQHPHPPPR